ncbi:MAG TPA: hypothetical protein PLD27_13300 [bacterium]|nr:hypothetical protein [bacterium]HPQ19323.1 hypothetical protein [bacterium]
MISRQEKYIKEVYSKYWITAREKKYGFLEYDKKMLKIIYGLGLKKMQKY